MKYWVNHFSQIKLFNIVFYFLLAILPPDEDAQPFKNNSVYTNVIASLSIQLANYVSCITNKTIPPEWLDIASNLYLPFDNSTKVYLEYEGFDLSKELIWVALFEIDLIDHMCSSRAHYY